MRTYSLRGYSSNTHGQKKRRNISFCVFLLLLTLTSPSSNRSQKEGSVLSMVRQSNSDTSRRDFWDGFHEKLNMLEEYARLHPEDARAHYEYGILCLKGLHTANKAKDAFQKALSLKPDFFEAYNGLGWAYLDTWGMRSALLMPVPAADLERAVGCFDLAIERKPDYADSYLGLGCAYRQMGLHAKALRCLQRLIQLTPDDAAAWDLLSRTHEALAQYEEAIEARLQRMRFISEENKETAITCHHYLPVRGSDYYLDLIELGRLYEKIGQYDEAIDFYKQATEKKSDEPLAYHHLGLAYFSKGDKESAFAQLGILQSICHGTEPENACDHYAEDLFQRIHE